MYRYEIKGDVKRISTLSMFLTGVVPTWEDPANKNGGEYQIRVQASNPAESTLDHVNKVWEALVQDLVARRFPNP